MKKAKVIILAGQSNAVGVAYNRYLPLHFSPEEVQRFYEGFPKIRIHYLSNDVKSTGFVPVTVRCTDSWRDTLGPEVGIARTLNARNPNEEYYIIKCAFSGTFLATDWLPPSVGGWERELALAHRDEMYGRIRFGGERPEWGWCFHLLLEQTRDGLSRLEAAGLEPEIVGFCWMQGECDAFVMETVEPYGGRYEALLREFQQAFGKYLEQCVYVDAGISAYWACYRELNRVKAELAEREPNFRYLDTVAAGLATDQEPLEEPDKAHYDTESIIRLGELFAGTLDL